METAVTVVEEEPQKQENGKIFENQFDMSSMLPTAGQLGLSDKAKKILLAPVDDDDVEIRPDGLIYLPWMEYATRLNQAVGNGNWALIPQGMPRFSANMIYWGHWLIVKGKMCGFAIGEQEYQPQNRRMTYGDACEGAWSNALMRNCKHLGISLELWKPSFIRGWIAKYAEKKGNKWYKKGTTATPKREVPEQETPTEKPKDTDTERSEGGATRKAINYMKGLANDHWGEEEGDGSLKGMALNRYSKSIEELSSKQVSEIIDWLKGHVEQKKKSKDQQAGLEYPED